MSDKADWLSWSLQFILGLFVGALIGFGLLFRKQRYWHLWDQNPVILFVVGAALLGGGLASYYGDECWGFTNKVIPVGSPSENERAALASKIVGSTGVVLMLTAACLQFEVF